MKNRMTRLGCLVTLLFFSACEDQPSRTDLLSGSWQATSITEEDRPLKVQPEEISFYFSPDQTYEFRSTLNYREAGRYQLRKDYLITRDTLAPGGKEKAVEIIQLTPDSLRLRMIDRENERILQLVKTE